MAKKPATDAPEDPSLGTEWAEAVEWAVRNMSKKTMTRRRAGSDLRQTIWDWAKESATNKTKLITGMMPQAISLLTDATADDPVEDLVLRKEHAAVAEMKKFLKAAIAEALAEEKVQRARTARKPKAES